VSRAHPPVPDALRIAATLERCGVNLTIVVPGLDPIPIGSQPERVRVTFHSEAAAATLASRDHVRLAEAYLAGEIDIEGDLLEIVKVTDELDMNTPLRHKLWLGLQLRLRDRLAYDRESIAVQYDHPPEFYLPWLDRWRAYSHGFYTTPDDTLTEAQERKMSFAIDALGLEPGMQVLDMGSGWGCFVEFAGRRGIRVHGITISEAQYRYVSELISRENLPCSVELVNLLEYRPLTRFDGAVFLGTLEHVPEYDRVIEFLSTHLAPGSRFYADFCASRHSFAIGRFMKKYLWPGPITYMDVGRLVRKLIAAGFNIHELQDDTMNYAYTIRSWGDGMELHRKALAELTTEATVRAYLLFLRGSYHFLSTNRTQAYHLVAGLEPGRLRSG
jgi:cyclopropane-fatty-acyl-phospholipid synthase